MPSLVYDLYLWPDAAGGVVAQPLQELRLSAWGRSPADARREMQAALEWLHRQAGSAHVERLRDVELHAFKVEVRPDYGTQERRHPASYSLAVSVDCVTALTASDQVVAWLPALGLRFALADRSELRTLAERYILQGIAGLAPTELLKLLKHGPARLETLSVTVRDRRADAGRPDVPAALAEVAEPLTDRAVRKRLSHPWQRDDEVNRLRAQVAAGHPALVLIGPGGVGKTSVLARVAALAEQAHREERKAAHEPVPAPRFWQTSAGRLVAGQKYLGQWEERLQNVIAGLGEVNGWLCVEGLLDLVRLGGEGPGDSLAAFLLPYVQRREVRLIGEATPEQWSALRRLMPALADACVAVHVRPLDPPTARLVLDELLRQAETHQKVAAEAGVAERIGALFHRFMPTEPFPGPVVPFLRRLITETRRAGRPALEVAHVEAAFQRQTGLPDRFLRDTLPVDRAEVFEAFSEQIIDQPKASHLAADLVVKFKSGMNDPNRPVGVLLLCGPTGVGKTEWAKALTATFFGAAEEVPGRDGRLIRLDMSEYAGYDGVDRLMGGADGTPSELIRRIRRQPFSVVLFDEIEKASREVFDTLLGVFDEGRMTDRFGKTTSFRSAVVLMTSNLGADRQTSLGFGVAERDGESVHGEEVKRFFRPEFVNRLDAVVPFAPLAPATIRAITRKELARLAQRPGLEQATPDAAADRGAGRRTGAGRLRCPLRGQAVAKGRRAPGGRPAGPAAGGTPREARGGRP